MAQSSLGLNMTLPIYNQDGSLFHNLELKKFAVDSIVMSLGDKITGDVYYNNNALNVTMKEYVVYNDVKYMLVNPPTIVREGLASANRELKGLTKYSFEFYHPMYMLGNFPFTDVAVSNDEKRYLSESKNFSWIGLPSDYIDKLNKNLENTEWVVVMSERFPVDKQAAMSGVLQFSDNTIAEALKIGYETWGVPYVVDTVKEDTSLYNQGKRFLVQYGLPVEEILDEDNFPFVFRCGKDVGLKNNSRTPRNNKIVTRISGYGSENNIPYGYPQIVWDGAEDDPRLRYTLYDGIVGGRNVKLINHPFTRKVLMPSIYSERVNKKVNPNAEGYDPNIELIDYYDATDGYPNRINPLAPSYISHEFDVKPEMDDGESNVEILGAYPLNEDLTIAESWNDMIDADGNYLQSYFQMKLPILSFDLYACAAITEEMQINMRSGACVGCTFTVQVDWEDYKRNFYDEDGNFAPDGPQRSTTKYPKSNTTQIDVVLKKEIATFGTIMPNQYQYPQEGDEFVVLGISLPVEYIQNAEKRLDDEMKAYMLENNVYYFDYPLNFSEHFLATHTDILSQLKPNVIVRFEFADQEMQLFVKQLTIKYGSDVLPQYDITLTDNVDVVLNQIGQVVSDVEHLSSLISLIRAFYNKGIFGEMSTKLSKISDDTAQGIIGFLKGVWFGTKQWFIDKHGNANLNDTTVNGLLKAYNATINNVRSSNYTGDGIADTGWKITNEYGNGDSYAVFDKLYIRKKATFEELEIRRLSHAGGNVVLSPASGRICKIDYYDGSGNLLGYEEYTVPWTLFGRIITLLKPHNANNRYLGKRKVVQRTLTDAEKAAARTVRCYMFTDDGSTDTMGGWTVDALARCQTFNINTQAEYDGSSWTGTKVGNTYWWRRVRAVGNEVLSDGNKHDWVEFYVNRQDMSEDCDLGSDLPSVGDVMAQFGHWTRPELSAVITLESYRGDIRGFREYDQIMDFNLNRKNWVSIGYDASTGRAISRIYGDFYYGDMDGTTYVQYNAQTKEMNIKAHIIAGSTIGDDDESIEEFIEDVMHPAVLELTEHDYENQQAAEAAQALANLWNGWDSDMIATVNVIKAKGKVGYHDKITIENYCSPESMYTTLKADAERYSIDTTNLTSAYNECRAAYNKYTAETPEEITIGPDFDSFAAWFSTTTYYRNLIAAAVKELADAAYDKATLAKNQADSMNYLKKALQAKTQIEGGLMLTSIIALRQFVGIEGQEDDPSKYLTWSGMNGQYLSADSMAAWYGGEPYDVVRHPEYKNPELFPNLRYAKGVIRMDGTGYFAGGNIVWEADGSGSVAGGNIAWDKDGNIVIKGNTVNPSVQVEATKVDTTNYYLNGQNITDTLNALMAMFTREGSGTSSDPYKIKANYGLYTNHFLTALGTDSGGGGGSSSILLSTLGDVNVSGVASGQYLKWNGTKWVPGSGGGGGGIDITAVWNAMAQTTTEQINASHLSTVLNGYATQTWVSQQGYITSNGSCAYATSAGSAGYATSAGSAGYASSIPSRSLWGQNFDGTGNVSGDMSSVGHMVFSHTETMFKYSNGSYTDPAPGSDYNFKFGGSLAATYITARYGILSSDYVDAESDIRKKDIVNDFELDLDEIALARLIKFTWKDKHNTNLQAGGIAQEWQKILPEAVHESADGTLSMDYGKIGMVSAVSLARKVLEQKKEIESLNLRLGKIENLLGLKS